MDENWRIGREERRAVELRGYLVRADNGIADFRVLDVSYNGCGIETLTALEPGEKVKLSVLGRGAVAATVKWFKDRRAGLQFSYKPAPRSTKQSRARRTAVSIEAFLRRTSRMGYRVKAFDVSSTGCRCEFVERPNIEECVWIKFDGLEALEARVSWVQDSNAGFEFVTPIHPAVFDMMLQRWGFALDA